MTKIRSTRSGRFLAAAAVSLAISAAQAATDIQEVDVFTSAQDGYAIFRIPAIVPTTSGTLLAFAEGRKHGAGDAGQIDMVLRRSADGGRTWGPMQVVWSDGANTCGNPSPVVDASTGRIWLFSTWNLASDHESKIHDGTSTDTRRVFVMHSDDDGGSWTAPDEVTSSVKQADWRWYATGPCHGIQLRDGRLVIPANHSRRNGAHDLLSSHVIISDDKGATWRMGAPVGGHTNESTVAELDDGQLCLNMRNYRGFQRRAVAMSKDRGQTWSPPVNDPALVEPVCQGSLLRYPTANGQPSLFLFSNPASTKRERMTVRLSHDGCRTWSSGTLVYPGKSAYSDLCPLPDKQVGLLYEREAGKIASGRITFARIPIDRLLADAITTSTASTQRIDMETTPIMRSSAMPPIPDANGFASPFAGMHDGALIVAGGANFPDKKPWEGGKKMWYDTIFMLPDKATSWTVAGKLPHPIAYGVSITIPDGVLCVGGEDAQQTYADVFLMQRTGDSVALTTLPALPAPCANACGVLLGSEVYIMGGTSRPGATIAGSNVYMLDLNNRKAGWHQLEPWPGRPRMLATAGESGDRVYLCSGVDLRAGPDGKPARTYLSDAFCYEPGKGWKRVADLPRPAVAAPSPAMSIAPSTMCIIGGDDGKLAGHPPGPDHPGFVRTTLYYDSVADRWTEGAHALQSPVTLPAVPNGGSWILPNGEIRPGIRTPQVTTVQFSKE